MRAKQLRPFTSTALRWGTLLDGREGIIELERKFFHADGDMRKSLPFVEDIVEDDWVLVENTHLQEYHVHLSCVDKMDAILPSMVGDVVTEDMTGGLNKHARIHVQTSVSIDRIDVGEAFEQDGFAFHDRFRSQPAEISETEHGGAV